MTSSPWWQLWVPVVGALAGAVVGFLLSQGVEWCRRRNLRRAHWAALRAELEFCCQRAETYLRHDEPKAPLYRLPTTAYASVFPELVRDAKVTETEMAPLMRFFTEVEDFNRGLGLVQAALERNDGKKRRRDPAEFLKSTDARAAPRRQGRQLLSTCAGRPECASAMIVPAHLQPLRPTVCHPDPARRPRDGARQAVLRSARRYRRLRPTPRRRIHNP
jgi:hypothetical protein